MMLNLIRGHSITGTRKVRISLRTENPDMPSWVLGHLEYRGSIVVVSPLGMPVAQECDWLGARNAILNPDSMRN